VLTHPKHNHTYDASFGGDSINRPARSASARVLVEPRVTIDAPAISSVGHALVVHGRVRPDKSGEQVRLVAIDSSGRVHRLGTDFLDGPSTYRFEVPLGAGHWRLQVRIGRTGGNAAGHSPQMRIVRD